MNRKLNERLTKWRMERQSDIREQSVILHLIRINTLSLVGLTIVLALFLTAILAPVIAPYPEDIWKPHISERLQPPNMEHLFGTDELGRDILSRVIFGASLSLQVAIVVIAVCLAIGVPLGATAGYIGGWVDMTIMRITDIFLAFPNILLAMCIAALLSPSLVNTMIAISITWWPWYARMARGLTLSLKEQQYVEAARGMGAKGITIIRRHILPNCLGPLAVQASLDLGWAILTTASLGFIGLGAQPPQPEWGLMTSLGRRWMPQWWWVATFPALATMITVLGFNFLGDAFRDIIDPRLRR